jgi:hypothetical protein
MSAIPSQNIAERSMTGMDTSQPAQSSRVPMSTALQSPEQVASSITPSIFDWETLKLWLIEWIVVMHIAFSRVENDSFRQFLAVLSPSLEKWIPRAGNTVRSWILAEFEQRQDDIKKQLPASRSRIHLSFDLWTSPNHLFFVGTIVPPLRSRLVDA